MRLIFSLCLASLVAAADVILVDRVVAVVDTTAITRSAVEERARVIELLSQRKTAGDAARNEALNELIDELLVARDAGRLRVGVEDSDVENALLQVAQQNQLSLAQLTDEVRKQGLSLAVYRGMLKRKLLELRWVNLRMERDGLSSASDPGEYMLKERNRLIALLRQAAAIEVRP